MSDIEVEFKDISLEEKCFLLDVLGYYVDDNGLIYSKETGQKHICPITNEEVYIKNASILPGSTIVMNTTEVALSEYFSRYLDKVTA